MYYVDTFELLSMSTSSLLSTKLSKMPALAEESNASLCLRGYSQLL